MLKTVTQQVGQANINATKLAALLVPLPPERELIRITEILNNLLQFERETINYLGINDRIDTLIQGVLSRAFRGELQTNDPNEESAIKMIVESSRD